jgi:hypothetical protein
VLTHLAGIKTVKGYTMTPTVYRTDQVRGSLLDSNGIYSGDVLLHLRIAQLPGERGFDDAAITDVSVTFGGRMPADGEYTAQSSWHNRRLQYKLRIARQKPVVFIH